MRIIITLIVLSSLSLILSNCGNQVALTGGPKDERAPVLDTSISTKNLQTNFIKEDITLYFDEFINLRDAAKQILISPPLENPPKINSRGSSLIFSSKVRLP